MRGLATVLLMAITWSLLASLSAPVSILPESVIYEEPPTAQQATATDPAPLPPPPPLMVQDVLADGVVIVVSKASQQMHVFRNGEHWGSSPVSTGMRGHTTPAGVFAILQKNVHHRSNIYSNAPMPYMQRLTWGGIAMHAGHLPGYPASHGCIRLPRAFAADLYQLTRFGETAVIVGDDPVADPGAAFALASRIDSPVPLDGKPISAEPVKLAEAQTPAPAPAPGYAPKAVALARGGGQTIQLVAALSRGEASAHWAKVVHARPDLAGMQKSIEEATVGSRRYYRLRVTAPGAHGLCRDLKRSGFDCFAVT